MQSQTANLTNQTVHHDCTHAEDCNHDLQHPYHNADNQEDSIDKRIATAREICLEKKIRFTKLREQVYKLVLCAHKPIGAYELISQMQQQIDDDNKSKCESEIKPKKIAPPTVYRSLDFLLSVGFIHQLTSVNAFLPCCHPRDKHLASFLICTECKQVQECSNSAVHSLINHTKDSIGFVVKNAVIEMTGVCQVCQGK